MPSEDFAPQGSFRAFFQLKLSPSWLSAKNAAGFFGVLLAVAADEAVETMSIACRMSLLDDEVSPDDVLPIIELDRRLPRYPLETAAQHRARLQDAWDIYELGGSELAIETQLRAAGYGPTVLLGDYGRADVAYGDPSFVYGDLGAYVEFRPSAPGPRGEPPPYRTQFWITFAEQFHPIKYDMIAWGDFEWGSHQDGVWSYVGWTDDFVRTVMGIVLKWKPSDHVFRGFTFVLDEIAYGDPSITYGDPTRIYGSTIDVDVQLGTQLF